VRDRHTRLAAAAILSRSARRSRLPDLLLCSSGLLIRGFGVQVPGGAPVLTWGFTTSGHFYAPGLSRFPGPACSLLARLSDVGAGADRPVWTDWSRPVEMARSYGDYSV
jgi:hypothetical protein